MREYDIDFGTVDEQPTQEDVTDLLVETRRNNDGEIVTVEDGFVEFEAEESNVLNGIVVQFDYDNCSVQVEFDTTFTDALANHDENHQDLQDAKNAIEMKNELLQLVTGTTAEQRYDNLLEDVSGNRATL